MDTNTKIELKQHFRIESARFLPHLPEGHPCRRTHGHSFKITLTLRGPLNSQYGWLIDYNEIKSATHPVLAEIDHRLLNEVAGLQNPTTENLCIWLFERLRQRLPALSQVAVSETEDTSCSYPVSN